MENKKKILICPLNWGLGHATRDVPIIKELLEKGNEVVIAADGYPLKFLQEEFPQLRTIEYPSYPVQYSKKNTQVFALMKFLPKMFRDVEKEHKWLEKLLKKEQFDMVISDNRFGLWSKKVHSVYITHQVMIKMPKPLQFLEPITYQIHKEIIEKYDECWIPDYEADGGLSGDLSHKYPVPKNAKFVGMLSRFSALKDVPANPKYKNVVILSGVEPQRTIFEKKMLKKYEELDEKTLLIIGKPAKKVQTKKVGQVKIVSHLSSEELAAVFKGAHTIVSRSGYTTVMDLEALQVLKKVHFFPTPGQTEQEYLADYLKLKGYIQ